MAGKTTILYKLRELTKSKKEIETKIPMIALTIETFEHSSMILKNFDIGGRSGYLAGFTKATLFSKPNISMEYICG